MKWYVGDWIKDPNVSRCSPSTRGIWFDLLCSMHEMDRSGQLTGTLEELARLGRCTADQFLEAIAQLSSSQTATVQRHSHGRWSVTCRRMSRESHIRKQAQIRKQNQRVRKKSRESHTPSSCSGSCSGERTTSKNEVALSPAAAEPAANGAGGGREAPAASRFSLKDCRSYADALADIKSPAAFAKSIWRSGEDDALIAEFLERGGHGETEEERRARITRSARDRLARSARGDN
jgi:hypothetical protein